jgi:hypothetical protein
VGPRAVLNAVLKRRIFSSRRESNLRTPIVKPAAVFYKMLVSGDEGSLAMFPVLMLEVNILSAIPDLCLKAKL